MNGIARRRRSDKAAARLSIQPRRRLRKLFTKESLLHAAHVMGPTLTALMFAGASSAVAHAQGTMDFSGATTLMDTFKTTALSVIHRGAEAAGYSVEGFAPTSRAANQLREAGIPADTLQGFLARTRPGDVDRDKRHLYFLDESSLSSTRQMRDFLRRIGDQDRVLLIGDTRQHQAVEAGKPFEQLQQAGMRTVHLDQIIRQKEPELRRAVEYLAQGDTETGLALLQDQGRIREVPNKQERIQEIARNYADAPAGTLIVSPDNASRRQINEAVRSELHQRELLGHSEQSVSVLVPRSEVTGADRAWASQYEVGDVLRYRRGSGKHCLAGWHLCGSGQNPDGAASDHSPPTGWLGGLL